MGQDQAGCRPVRFRNDPNLGVSPRRVDTQKPVTVLEGEYIFSFILLTQFAPVTRLMPLEKLHGILASFLKGL